MSKNLVKEEKKELAVLTNSFFEDAAVNDFISTTDMAMPYFSILEKLSPQVDSDSPKYLENAKPGMIHNNVSDKLYDGKQGLKVIPCFYEKKYVEWIPRNSGGGYVGEYDISDKIATTCKKDKNDLILPNGNFLVETAYFYILNLKEENELEYGIIGMSKTRLKSARNWCTLLKNILLPGPQGRMMNPPIFSHIYDLKTMKVEKNNNSYYIWDAADPIAISDQNLYDTAKSFYKAISSGNVKKSAPSQEVTETVLEDCFNH